MKICARSDMNVVDDRQRDFVEIQAAAEGRPFTGSEMQDLRRWPRRESGGFRKCSADDFAGKVFWRAGR